MWTVKTGVCEKTIECHEDKIWTLQVIEPSADALDRMAKRKRRMAETETQITDFKLMPDEYRRYVSAGGDGRIIVWSDITEEHAQEQARLAAERLAQVQTLENFIRLEKYEDALKLTLTLDHPYQ
jgi:U3 small nucleolar RNA-associated protein 13